MDITLEQLQEQIAQLSQQLSELALNNELDHGSIIDQIENSPSTPSSDISNIQEKIELITENIVNIKSKLSSIDTNSSDIVLLQNELSSIQKDLSKYDLSSIKIKVNAIEAGISNISNVFVSKTNYSNDLQNLNDILSSKVSDTDLLPYDERLTELEEKSKMATVADEVIKIKESISIINDSLTTINSNINNGAVSTSDLSARVADLSRSIQSDIEVLNQRCTDIEEDIRDNSGRITNTNTKLAETNCAINNIRLKCNTLLGKLDEIQSLFNSKLNTIESKLDGKISNTKLSLSNEFAAAIRDHNRYQQGHSREFTEIKTRLEALDGKNGEIKNIKKSLEKEWIVILTPEEYKKIPSANIKQNQLYMCMKYGKPYELYIGSVLIAKRNTVKESGFIYTFPLSF